VIKGMFLADGECFISFRLSRKVRPQGLLVVSVTDSSDALFTLYCFRNSYYMIDIMLFQYLGPSS
jgi:hypothetical protein